MKRTLLAAISIALCIGLCGCGDSHEHEEAMFELLELNKELNDVLDTVKDESSANAAVSKIEDIGRRKEPIRQRLKKLGKPASDTQNRVEKKYGDRIAKESARLQAHFSRIGPDSDIGKVIGPAMTKTVQ